MVFQKVQDIDARQKYEATYTAVMKTGYYSFRADCPSVGVVIIVTFYLLGDGCFRNPRILLKTPKLKNRSTPFTILTLLE